jgi:hypothetical protein
MKRLIVKLFNLNDFKEALLDERKAQKKEDEKRMKELLNDLDTKWKTKHSLALAAKDSQIAILMQDIKTLKLGEEKQKHLSSMSSSQIQENYRVVGEMRVIMESLVMQINSLLGQINGVHGRVDLHIKNIEGGFK